MWIRFALFWNITQRRVVIQRYNKELMQPFGDSDILSFVRISRLNWIGRVNRMDSKRKLSQVFHNNSQGSRLRGRPKTKLWNCVQILIDTK
jgi:hypothetical protein